MIVDEGLELLDETQCLSLLASAEIGRVGVSIAALPAIFPVNFRLIDGAIVFRTSPGTKLEAAAAEAVLAFEADDFAVADRSGWSVLAVGRSHVVTDPAVREQARQVGLEPFADGPRHTLVAIDVEVLSGRRLVHSPPPGGPGWAFAG
jgi:nitroimidazol reductase NimA-like FMN-containing flavoprotein (pyridoxamine 5'-phosphate oxidase superfamily)